MDFKTEFVEIALEELHREAAILKTEGWRFIQTHAVNTDAGVDLYYSFMKDGLARNLKVVGVTKDDAVPSITDLFLAAFVFENEARELFGVDMRDIAIDFAGALYAPAESEPMTFMSPEQKAAREKARKASAAKAAKAQAGDAESATSEASKVPGARVFVMTPERKARLDAKMADMSPEKRAKVEAALKAREAEAAAAAQGATAVPQEAAVTGDAASNGADAAKDAAVHDAPKVDTVLESKIALLEPDKADKVRAVLAGRGAAAATGDDTPQPAESALLDAVVEQKLAAMEPAKAEKVRAVLAATASRGTSRKGGE